MNRQPESRPVAPASFSVLQRRAFLLGGANALDYAIQFLLPVVLVRCLDAGSFGEYRLLWLMLTTVMVLAPLAMPQSLYYFLPRSDQTAKRLYVHQTVLYLAMAGMAGALLISPWNPLLPENVRAFGQYGQWVPALVVLLVTSSLLDLLPTIEERVVWQSIVTISLSLLRALTLAAGAYLTGDLGVLIWLLVAFATIKLFLLLGYVSTAHGLSGPWLQRSAFVEQLRQAVPFGFSGALYGLRGQADQWVAASLFAVQSFAAFSIAAVLGPLLNLFRLSVNHAFLPSMSRLQASGDIKGMLDLNNRANVMVAALAYPMLAFAFVFTEELLTVVYTATYVEAAPAMRVYIVSLLALVIELLSVTLLLKEGAFALRLNLLALLLSIALSWLAARHYGLAGAAAGSVTAIYIDRWLTLRRIGQRTGTPLRQLQDWNSLTLLLLFSALAAGLAWLVTTQYLAGQNLIVRLIAGCATLAGAYAAMTAVHGIGRGWLISAFRFRT